VRWIMLAKREIRAGRQDATTPVAPGPLPADELAPGGAERLVPCVAARPLAAAPALGPALAGAGRSAVELGAPGPAGVCPPLCGPGPRPPPAGCPAGGALTRAAAGLGGGETAGAADPRGVADARGSARGAEAPGAAGAPGAAEALGAAEAPGALGAAEAPGAAGAARPENDLRTDSAGLAARRCADRAVVAAAVSLAWSCWVSIGPAPVTASIRRTGATVDTKLSTMPPGVQDS
jgi:hypothetical protein